MTPTFQQMTWDNNGACFDCGYMPIKLTEFCTECEETTQISYIRKKYAPEIAEMEDGLHALGVQYLYLNDISIPLIYGEEQYNELDKKLREYKHLGVAICPWTNEKLYYPEEQLVNRVKKFLLYDKNENKEIVEEEYDMKNNLITDEETYSDDDSSYESTYDVYTNYGILL